MKKIILNDTVYNLCLDYECLKPVLIQLGYRNLRNSIYFNLIAKNILLDQALSKQNITIDKLNNALKKYDCVAITPKPIDMDRIQFLKSILINLNKTNDYKKAKADLMAHLHYVEAYEIGIALNELMNDGATVEEIKKTFYLRTLVFEGNLKDDVSTLSEESKELFDFIQLNNKKIKAKLDKLLVYLPIQERIALLQTLYFDLTKYYVFKENYLLKPLKNAGNSEPFKIISTIDKNVLDLIQKQIKYPLNDNKELSLKIEEICYKANDLIFKDENILIYLINIFVRKKIIAKINKKIKSKNKNIVS
ncbi:DUF438 domain-containing protein [Malacoplasma muris]|uniref:DUF438 domain-containing protein n=1 Tax=Malacoplasma muris TaxID=2119 RepID=UPI00398E43BA